MKKILIVLSLIMSMIMLASCGNDAATEKHDFRNVDLGMTAVELIAAEGEPDQQFSDMYTYLDKKVCGVSHATLTYELDESGVCSIRAEFTNEYSDDKSYINEYNTIKENLIKEWGEPDGISEDDTEFKFMCFWKYNYLMLLKNDDGSVSLSCECFQSND